MVWSSRSRMSATDSTVAAPVLPLDPTAGFTSVLITFSLGHNRVYTILLNVVISNFANQIVMKMVWMTVQKWASPAVFFIPILRHGHLSLAASEWLGPVSQDLAAKQNPFGRSLIP